MLVAASVVKRDPAGALGLYSHASCAGLRALAMTPVCCRAGSSNRNRVGVSSAVKAEMVSPHRRLLAGGSSSHKSGQIVHNLLIAAELATVQACFAEYLCSVDDDDLPIWQQHSIIHVAAVRHCLLLPAGATTPAAAVAAVALIARLFTCHVIASRRIHCTFTMSSTGNPP